MVVVKERGVSRKGGVAEGGQRCIGEVVARNISMIYLETPTVYFLVNPDTDTSTRPPSRQ